MPINKFGSHYLDNKPDIDEELLSKPLFLCNSSQYFSKCFLRLRGKKTNRNKAYYVLDNEGTAFIFPLSGKINTVRHYAADGDVVINSVTYKYHALSGMQIQTGDKIEFKLGTPDVMCADFVLDCPLEKNV